MARSFNDGDRVQTKGFTLNSYEPVYLKGIYSGWIRYSKEKKIALVRWDNSPDILSEVDPYLLEVEELL